MAESSSAFNNYIEEGSKLSSLKNLFGFLEKVGNFFKNLKKGISDAIGTVTDLYNNIKNSTYVSDLLKKLGLTDEAIGIINKLTGGSINALDGALGDMLDTGLAAIETYGSEILNLVKANIYLPENVFLASVKALHAIGSDPNLNSTLFNTAIRHDMPKVLEWLDDINGTTYSIEEDTNYIAFEAAEFGAFNISKYVMEKMGKAWRISINQAAYNSEEVNKIKEQDALYKEWFIDVFKRVFLYSYGNFDVNKMKQFIEHTFDGPDIKMSNLGTSDRDFFLKYAITEEDVDIVAPLYTVRYDYAVGEKEKTYILPPNKNIKKLYVYAVNGVKNNPLESKALHDRLKYPIYTVNTSALSALTNTFRNSGIGQFISNAKDNYLAMISNLCIKSDPILFDPMKQDLKSWGDKTVIPDFIDSPTSSLAPGYDDYTKKEPPLNETMIKLGLTYDRFGVIEITENTTTDSITTELMNLLKDKPTLKYKHIFTTPYVDFKDLNVKTSKFHVYYDEVFDKNVDKQSNEFKDTICMVIVKYLIDKYIANESGYTLETLSSTYYELAKYFGIFKDYFDAMSDNNDQNKEQSTGIKSLSFYEQIVDPQGNTIQIKDTGLVSVSPSGAVSNLKFPSNYGTITGMALDSNNNIVVAVKTSDGKYAYYMKNAVGEWILVETTDELENIFPGLGFNSPKNITFYKAVYYDDKYYVISTTDSKDVIKVYDNLSDKNVLGTIDALDFINLDSSKRIQGLSILTGNRLATLISNTVYLPTLGENNLSLTSYKALEPSLSDEEINVKENQIGTILDSVSINYDEVYDIDIDDAETINNIVKYYKTYKPITWAIKVNNKQLTIVREEGKYVKSKIFTNYSDPNDDSVRKEVDYYGNKRDTISSLDYKESKVFRDYLDSPPKTDSD